MSTQEAKEYGLIDKVLEKVLNDFFGDHLKQRLLMVRKIITYPNPRLFKL